MGTLWYEIREKNLVDAVMALTGVFTAMDPDSKKYSEEELMVKIFPQISTYLLRILGSEI